RADEPRDLGTPLVGRAGGGGPPRIRETGAREARPRRLGRARPGEERGARLDARLEERARRGDARRLRERGERALRIDEEERLRAEERGARVRALGGGEGGRGARRLACRLVAALDAQESPRHAERALRVGVVALPGAERHDRRALVPREERLRVAHGALARRG